MAGLSRRSFLKRAGTTAVVAAGAVGAADLVAANPSEAVVTGNIDGIVHDAGGQVFDITQYGAIADAVRATGGSVSTSSTTFTTSSSTFSAGDVNKLITIQGAGSGGQAFGTTISAVASATQVTLAASVPTGVTGAAFSFGTDNTPMILTASTAAGTAVYSTGRLFAPAGVYMFSGGANSSKQILFSSRGGLFGAGGRAGLGSDAASTVFLCGDASAGLLPNASATYEGFLVDGNNVATAPLQNGVLTGGLATSGGSYGTFVDVWVTGSAANGWGIFGSQNNSYLDCGSTSNAQDGLYIDGGAGGHDFWNFYEARNRRYGVHGDTAYTAVGGYITFTGDVRFFGGCLDTPSGAPQGVSKVYLRGCQDWRFLEMAILGTNLSGPTVDLSQGTLYAYGQYFRNCWISSTTTGGSPGRACIQIADGAGQSNAYTFVKTDGTYFAGGDTSVYVTATGNYRYSAVRWIYDGTTNGPLSGGSAPPIDVILGGRTGAWQTAALASPWSGSVSYRVDADGRIQLRGSASGGTSGSTLFTLSSGYRPTSTTLQIPAARSGGGLAFLSVNTSGAVQVTQVGSGSLGTVTADGVCFPVA